MAIDVESYYIKYGPMVLRRCRRLLVDEGLAMDAMQDTFILLIRHQNKLREEYPSPLLYRICTNVCLSKIRQTKNHRTTPDSALLDRIASLHEPENQLVAKNILNKLFGKGKASTQEMAVMHFYDGLTHEEVAKRVNMSVSGVRKRLRILRAQLVEIERGTL